MIQKLSYLIILTLLSLATQSCQPHDPFCFHHPHGAVLVEYDWAQAPDAKDIRGTRCYFYRSEDGSYVTTANFSGMKGGSLYLEQGTYDVISYNSDTDKLHWRGTNALSSLETYTRDASLTEDLPGYNYEKIDGLVLTPNRLWSGREDRVYVSRNDTTIITLMPLKATYEVIWEVTGIKGVSRVNACAVSISNVGGSLMLNDWHTERNNSLMSGVGRKIINKTKNKEDIGGFQGEFEAFGCNFLDECSHTFTIYCWATGGNIKASYNVADQFHIVKEDRKIYIKIKADIEIPNGGNSDSGFRPDIDGWGEENEDIIL